MFTETSLAAIPKAIEESLFLDESLKEKLDCFSRDVVAKKIESKSISIEKDELVKEMPNLDDLREVEWNGLLEKLNIPEKDISRIQLEYTFPKNKARDLLRKWASEHGRSEEEKLEDIFGFSKDLIKAFNTVDKDNLIKIYLKSNLIILLRVIINGSSLNGTICQVIYKLHIISYYQILSVQYDHT